MQFRLVLLPILATLGLTTTQAQAQQIPEYYVGAGARFGLNDNLSFVIDSKAKITDLGDFSLSARPALLLGNDVELRLPLSVDAPLYQGLYPYLGGGVAYNVDGSSDIDPLITGGVDISVGRNLILDLGLNVIFKSADTDTEFAATLNYVF